MKKIKILHVLQSNRFSGAENVVCQIIDMFKENEDIEMAYTSADGDIRHSLEEREVYFIPMKKLTVLELKKSIELFKPDIIHAHDVKASFLSSICKKKHMLLISHIHAAFGKMNHLSIKSMAFYLTSYKIKHIFWVSNSALDNFYFRSKVLEKSSVLYNVINKNILYEKIISDSTQYDFDIIFLGRITEQKDPMRFLDIINDVRKEKSDISVAIVGTGDMEHAFINKIKDLKLNGNIKLFGYMKNPYKLLSQCKVMLMSSKFEGTPMCALEAMALGVPIVSTPTDGLIDVIKHNETGYYSNSNIEIKKYLIEIIENEDIRKKMSQNSIERFEYLVDIIKYKKSLESEYNL